MRQKKNFFFRRYVRKVDKDVALELADTLDFKNSSFKIDDETDRGGKPLRPHHYKVFMNPYNNEDDYVVEAIYKKPYEVPYPDPFPKAQKTVYRELINCFIKVAEQLPNAIPKLIDKLNSVVLPQENDVTIGTHGELFGTRNTRGQPLRARSGSIIATPPKHGRYLRRWPETRDPFLDFLRCDLSKNQMPRWHSPGFPTPA
ncbi:MAG: hypothetical protein U5K69_11170 [Balneolaceae bacterium]|nr:hypothetical protein [Balneolaceae bacterium]